MANVFVSVWLALRYSVGNTFKKPLLWLLLTLFCLLWYVCYMMGGSFVSAAVVRGFRPDTLFGIILLLISFVFGVFFLGIVFTVLGRREIRIRNFFELVWCGLRGWVIIILYLLVPVIVTLCLLIPYSSVFGISDSGIVSYSLFPEIFTELGIWSILVLIVFLIFTVFMIPALTAYARQNQFSAAFNIKELGAMIRDAKWYRILAGVIVYTVVLIALSFVLIVVSSLFVLVPVAGFVFAVVVQSLLLIFIVFFIADYWVEFFA